MRGTVVGVGADHSEDDLFEAALKRRKEKADGGGGAVSLHTCAAVFAFLFLHCCFAMLTMLAWLWVDAARAPIWG